MKLLSIIGGFILGAALFFTNRALFAEEYAGASVLIREIQAAQAEKPQDDEVEKADAFAKRVEDYSERVADLFPQDAAGQWLELVDTLDEATTEPTNQYGQSDDGRGLAEVVKAIPGPTVWPALREAIESRPAREGRDSVREYALQMLAHVLVGDGAAQHRDLEKLERAVSDLADRNSGWQWTYSLQELASALANAASDPELAISLLESRIESQRESPAGSGQQGNLSIPDLVTLLGPDQAEKMLRRALAAPIPLDISVGVETKQLARRLALEMIDELGVAQWGLCNSIDATELFEALETRFVKPAAEKKAEAKKQQGLGQLLSRLVGMGEDDHSESSEEERYARVYYFLGLIVQDRTKEATDFSPQVFSDDHGFGGSYLFDSVQRQIREAGHSEQLYQFLKELLTHEPELDFWESYINLATETGHGKEMLEHVRTLVEDLRLKPDQRLVLKRHLRNAHLAVDNVEAGIALLRKELSEPDASDDDSGVFTAAIKLAKIGKLLEEPKWIEEGLRHASESLIDKKSELYQSQYERRELVVLLLDLDRGPEAERICKQAIQEGLMVAAKSNSEWMGPFNQGNDLPETLSSLLHVYAKAGRHQDVMTLLDDAPWWGVKDLAKLETTDENFSMDVATALAREDKKEEALHLVRRTLSRSPGDDRAYQLLLQIEGEKALPLLEQLIRRDRFEERPLIWKARLLLNADKVNEAEIVIRQAIAMDPSDGEQGKGDRMRAYAVLADIYQTRSNKEQEKIFRRVIKAIRLAENADDFYNAGLKTRGIAKYREALLQFADAYCIESRLAIQLAGLGLMEEAAHHYQRAFELMPDSFGRVESHCFGCENAFSGNLAQQTAEQVFARIAEANPDQPQIHYLIGYLREAQQRFPEALEAYQQAVKLDPGYLNAWNKILEVRHRIFLPRDIQDEATLNVMRLDPLGKHSYPSTGQVTDLSQLWHVFSEIRLESISIPATIYPLQTSSKLIEKQEHANRDAGTNMAHAYFYQERSSMNDANELKTPGELIAQNDIIRVLCDLFDLANDSE